MEIKINANYAVEVRKGYGEITNVLKHYPEWFKRPTIAGTFTEFDQGRRYIFVTAKDKEEAKKIALQLRNKAIQQGVWMN